MARLARTEVDVIVLTETWPELEGLCGLTGFKSFFKSNPDTRAGGVAIYVREGIQCYEIAVNEPVNCDICLVETMIERKNTDSSHIQISLRGSLEHWSLHAGGR